MQVWLSSHVCINPYMHLQKATLTVFPYIHCICRPPQISATMTRLFCFYATLLSALWSDCLIVPRVTTLLNTPGQNKSCDLIPLKKPLWKMKHLQENFSWFFSYSMEKPWPGWLTIFRHNCLPHLQNRNFQVTFVKLLIFFVHLSVTCFFLIDHQGEDLSPKQAWHF